MSELKTIEQCADRFTTLLIFAIEKVLSKTSTSITVYMGIVKQLISTKGNVWFIDKCSEYFWENRDIISGNDPQKICDWLLEQTWEKERKRWTEEMGVVGKLSEAVVDAFIASIQETIKEKRTDVKTVKLMVKINSQLWSAFMKYMIILKKNENQAEL